MASDSTQLVLFPWLCQLQLLALGPSHLHSITSTCIVLPGSIVLGKEELMKHEVSLAIQKVARIWYTCSTFLPSYWKRFCRCEPNIAVGEDKWKSLALMFWIFLSSWKEGIRLWLSMTSASLWCVALSLPFFFNLRPVKTSITQQWCLCSTQQDTRVPRWH